MVRTNSIYLGVISILLLVIWFRGCKPDDDRIIEVTVPEVQGHFIPETPTHRPLVADTVYITRWTTARDTVEVPSSNPVDQDLLTAYQTARDSIDRFKLYLSSIEIKGFSNREEDDNIIIDTEGVVRGEVISIASRYTVKEKTIEVPDPIKKRSKVLIGAQVQAPLTLNDVRYSLNLHLQNRKNALLTLGYAKLSGENYVTVGYAVPIFGGKR